MRCLFGIGKRDWPQPPNRPTGPPIINARIEKLPTGFWVGAFSNSRCIVPMIGYYEWTDEKGDTTPHCIHGHGLLSAAGLTWTMEIAGEQRRVVVVVTPETQAASGEVHDRMPAFMTPELWDEWLSPDSLTAGRDTAASKANRYALLDALDASSRGVAATIRTHIVDRRVNSVRAVDPYDPAIIEAI